MPVRIILVIAAFLGLSMTACRKEDNSLKNCIIVKTIVRDSFPTAILTQATDFAYVNEALVGIVGGYGPAKYAVTISRSNGLITAITVRPDTVYDTLQIDTAGFVLLKKSKQRNASSRNTYVYNDAHQLQSVVTYLNDTLADSVLCYWNNGDCVSMDSKVTGITNRYYYDYDIIASAGDVITYADWLGNYGARTMNNIHAVNSHTSSYNYGDTDIYTYKRNYDQVIAAEIGVVFIHGDTLNALRTYTYTYDCK